MRRKTARWISSIRRLKYRESPLFGGVRVDSTIPGPLLLSTFNLPISIGRAKARKRGQVDRAASNRARARDNNGYRWRHLIDKQHRGFARVARCKLITWHFAHPSVHPLSFSPRALTTFGIFSQWLIDIPRYFFTSDQPMFAFRYEARLRTRLIMIATQNVKIMLKNDGLFPLNDLYLANKLKNL